MFTSLWMHHFELNFILQMWTSVEHLVHTFVEVSLVIFIFFILDMNKCRVGQSSCSYIWSFSYFSFQVWMSVVSQSSCSHICRSIIGCLIFSILDVNLCRLGQSSCSHICRNIIVNFHFSMLDVNQCRLGQSSCLHICRCIVDCFHIFYFRY